MILLTTSGLTLLLLLLLARDFWRLRSAQGLPAQGLPATLPLVSVLIPARNEVLRIGRCLDGVLAQQYPNYEAIVVDDGSTDGTDVLLARAAAHDSRLRVLAGRPLPPGWAGKPNACQQAAEAASGEWLLFLDADTAAAPTLLGATLAHAQRQQLAMLSVFPLLELGSFWERVIMPPFLGVIMAVFPIERLNNPDLPAEQALANGQCILVRRDAYLAMGGHGTVRDAVLEDVHLAQAMRRSGQRVGVAVGLRHLQVRMYTSLAEIVEGLTKNAVAGARAGGGRSIWAGVRLNLLAFGPLWLLALGVLIRGQGHDVLGLAILAHGVVAGVAALSLWALMMRRMYQLHPATALLWPLGLLCYDLIALRAAWFVWSGRGIVWKGRAYAG